MASTADELEQEIADWTTDLFANQRKYARSLALELFRRVVIRTPVGNRELWAENKDRLSRGLPAVPRGYVGGRARANWICTYGSASATSVDRTDAGGAGTIGNIIAAVNGWSPENDAIFLANNLPYIQRLERGWSKQAPSGMVAVAMAEVNILKDSL
jgi:hypothetical protein